MRRNEREQSQTIGGESLRDPLRRPAELGDPRAALVDLYWAGVRAVSPGPALRSALDRLPPLDRPVWIIALGKAALPMATAAVDALAARGAEPVGGIIIAPRAAEPPHPSLQSVAGDHPLPGARSTLAAHNLDSVIARVKGDDEIWVLLSGGASSLAAAPEAPIAADELLELFTALLGSGADIAAMNAIRKRFTRWGAGRLAVALHPARVRQFIVSDVIGDDLAAIGSGPCVPDPATAPEIRERLTALGLAERLPASVRDYLARVERDARLETPKAGHPAFALLETRVVASNRVALEAIAARAAELGYAPHVLNAALAGEAADVGRDLVAFLTRYLAGDEPVLPTRSGDPCLIWGGETTVTLPPKSHGRGGRCQELALAAAQALDAADLPPGVTLLAAGTDGRDGDTDAAGAIVHARTWRAIAAAGVDPDRALTTHDSHTALDAAGALLRTGLTATNVMDVVVALAPRVSTAMPR